MIVERPSMVCHEAVLPYIAGADDVLPYIAGTDDVRPYITAAEEYLSCAFILGK